MRPLKRDTSTDHSVNATSAKIPHQIAGHALTAGLLAANDQSPSQSKGLLARRRKRQARRSIH